MTHAEAAIRLRRTVEHTVGKKARIILERATALALLSLAAVADSAEGKQLSKELGRRAGERLTIEKATALALLEVGPAAAAELVTENEPALPTGKGNGNKNAGKGKSKDKPSTGDKTPPQGAETLDDPGSPAAGDVL